MRNRYGILTGFIILAIISMAGICAAEDTTNVTATATETTVAATATDTPVPSDTPGDDGIAPYDGPAEPGSPLYGLRIAFEDLDESFTFNETERLNKQLNHAKLRLSEVKRELLLNNTKTADEALELYWQKINITQMRLDTMASSNETGLLHAQEMITKHQMVLEGLMLSHPDNTGLARAYNNSLTLERKFEQKTEMKFERIMDKNNETILKAVRLEVRDQEHTANRGDDTTLQVQQTLQEQQGPGSMKSDDKGNDKGQKPVVNQTASQGGQAQPATGNGPAGQQTGNQNGKPATGDGAQSGNADNRGNSENSGNTATDNRGQANGRSR
jgi:hypothetical protein